MTRTVIIALLIVIATLLAFEMSDGTAEVQATDDIGQVIQNQKLILEKLNNIDKKLDVIKMRIKI